MLHCLLQRNNQTRHDWVLFFLTSLLFIMIFSYPWNESTRSDEFVQPPDALFQAQRNWQGHAYFFGGDSHTYVLFNAWRDPWSSYRSIGYPAFLFPFLYPDQKIFHDAVSKASMSGTNVMSTPKRYVYAINTEIGLAKKFEVVALVQRILLSLAIVVFYISLCRWFFPLLSFAFLTAALWIAPPPDPAFIMTEPLSCALTYLCGAFLLFAPKTSRQGVFFALASLCAALAYLVRPQMLSLTALMSLIFLYQVYTWSTKGRVRAFLRGVIIFSPLVLAYGYIWWLSVTGGQLFLHTLPGVNLTSFCYFAESADAPHMPTERARLLTAWYGERKEKFIEQIFNFKAEEVPGKVHITGAESPLKKRALFGDLPYYLGPFGDGLKYLRKVVGGGNLSLLERNLLGRELKAGLRHRHGNEMGTLVWQNWIGSLGYFKDVYYLALFPTDTFIINCAALLLAGFAIIISAQVRWPLLVMTGIHCLSILAAAFGNYVIGRYVEPTEAFLLLAGMCSLWILCWHAWKRLWLGTADAKVPV